MTTHARALRVCYFGTYRQEYSRNRVMIDGLRQAGVVVTECHESLWHDIEDRVQVASGGWFRPSFWRRVLQTYLRLLKRYHQVGQYDILITGYPGQYDVFLARLLSWMRCKPLVWDVLNSMYLIMLERGIAERHPLTAWLVRFAEKLACGLPDLLILDCAAFVDWFHKNEGIRTGRFRLVPIGADDTMVQQTKSVIAAAPNPESVFRVLYYGTFIPNHGTGTIVEAARLLANDPSIQFELVGRGPERDAAFELAKKYGLSNITFIDWLEKPQLVERIAACNVCLGTFGATRQALVTNNNKIYEGFAGMKPVLSGESPALPGVLKQGEHIYLCARRDPQALAAAIKTLRDDPLLCKRLSENGYRIFHQQFDTAHIGAAFAAHLQELVPG